MKKLILLILLLSFWKMFGARIVNETDFDLIMQLKTADNKTFFSNNINVAARQSIEIGRVFLDNLAPYKVFIWVANKPPFVKNYENTDAAFRIRDDFKHFEDEVWTITAERTTNPRNPVIFHLLEPEKQT